MTDTNLIERLKEDREMLSDGLQKNLTDAWHNAAMKQAAADCSEAAALIEQQEAILADLADALDDMTKHYVELAVSGDCGNWDPEKESEVIASRGLILAAKTHLEE